MLSRLLVIGQLLITSIWTEVHSEKESSLHPFTNDHSQLAQMKETANGQLVAEHIWVISDARYLIHVSPEGHSVPGPDFYTSRPGYKLRPMITTRQVNPSNGLTYVGVWFSLIPGLYDDVMEWPFPFTVNITLVAQNDPGNSLHLMVNPTTAICRLRKQFHKPKLESHNKKGCGKEFFVSHSRLLEESTPFLFGDELLLRTTVFLEERGDPPKRAKVFLRGHQMVSEFTWHVTEISEKKMGQVTSNPFYVNSESYLIILQMSFSGDDDVGLFIVLIPGDFDESLLWPFAYHIELSIVNPSATNTDRTASIDPTSGACPLAAFTKPRQQPNVPCGFRKLAKLSMLEAKGLQRNNSLLIKFTAILDQLPHFAKLAVKENFLVGEYNWRIPNIERKIQQAKLNRMQNLLSERFYTSDQGYLMQLQIKFENKTEGYIGLFLTLLEGAYDHLLEWPFAKKFVLSVLDQQQDSGHLEVIVDPSDPYIRSDLCSGSFWRPVGRNDACGSSTVVQYDQLYDRKFIRFGALVVRVILFLDELRPPRFATLSFSENFLVAQYVWRIPDLAEKIRETKNGRLTFIDSEKFYLSNNGYRMMLRLYPEKTEGFVGAYAVLTKGAYDADLEWPFTYNYKLEIIGSGNSISRSTFPGRADSGCPDIAFDRPTRELAEWSCGEGNMIAHNSLFKESFMDEDGDIKLAISVYLQELMHPIASIGFEQGSLKAKYSWILKNAPKALRLLEVGEKNKLESPVFYTENQGYAVRLTLSIKRNGNSGVEGELSVGLYWTLQWGPYDDVLLWPFQTLISLSIVDIRGGGKTIQKVIDPLHSMCPPEAFQRPRKMQNDHSCGFPRLITLNSLLADYVSNDVLHIKSSFALNPI
ncbi:uncharacterized protein [Parasteatoda tepidariorum]|uniref:uncharacterized protein n=1 Tax=Parasteatoda tepidariorum TaxID=114398 RepID=UPI001C71D1F5|nr:uncharacterized protein LOC107445970 [Parasteatoda tepidariorum]XP_042907207.1 uncharacterized protein LOC107445970 [Parasteatoda tepidariorum]